MVRAVLPTPPSPSTTSLYRVIFPAMLSILAIDVCLEQAKANRGPGRAGRGVKGRGGLRAFSSLSADRG